MPSFDESAPIAPDEILYRRIPATMPWFEAMAVPPMQPYAFRPQEVDTDGLSLYRARFVSPEQLAAHGASRHGYYVASLRVGDLLECGVQVMPSPDEGLPGHVLLPQLVFATRKTIESRALQERLTRLVVELAGPLPGNQGRSDP